MSGYLVGVDGGGTHTTVAVADGQGSELLRRDGPPGLVDPQQPERSARAIADQVRVALSAAGAPGPARALCAALAGVGTPEVRGIVRLSLERSGTAHGVAVCTDGEAALEGAFRGGPGILLVSGTGSIAYARGEDGRVERCGGWGMVAGDQGSGYWIGRESLVHALRAFDGRGAGTSLLPRLLAELPVGKAADIPGWLGEARKAEVAALARVTLEAAEEGDAVAARIVAQATRDLADHAAALFRRLAPWSGLVGVALHGGVASRPAYALREAEALETLGIGLEVRPPLGDAVSGALRIARRTPTAGG